jgi:hypothetical protein
MLPLPSRLLAVPAVAITLLLGGCVASSTGGTTSDGAPASGSNAGSTADCSRFDGQTEPALKLFTTDLIASGPAEGQTYGDGTELSITLSDEAIAAGLLPQFELNTIDSQGQWVAISSLAFDPTTGGDGTYSTSTFEFGNDEYVGTAIVAQIFAISDVAVGNAETYGDKLLLGNYCLTYGNDGS